MKPFWFDIGLEKFFLILKSETTLSAWSKKGSNKVYSCLLLQYRYFCDGSF